METRKDAQTLLKHLDSLKSFKLVDYCDGNYDHMGATIADAILQAGLKYDSVVRPRIQQIRDKYPSANTTSSFLKLLREVGAKVVLNWSGDEKPKRVIGLAEFFQQQDIETEQDLHVWLTIEANRPTLLRVRGIGEKTADYLKILAGLKTVAIDTHMHSILREAGIPTNNYNKAREIMNAAADARKMDRAKFDHSIWKFMSARKKTSTTCTTCP